MLPMEISRSISVHQSFIHSFIPIEHLYSGISEKLHGGAKHLSSTVVHSQATSKDSKLHIVLIATGTNNNYFKT